MKRFVSIVALALSLVAGGQLLGQVGVGLVDGVQREKQQHHFGMGWNGKHEAGLDLRLPLEVLDTCKRLSELPDRVERAASWGTFAAGAGSATVGLGVVATLALMAKRS